MGRVNLKLDWATHEAARIACERWHYSRSMPMPPMIRVGVWEDGEFVGVVLFSRGAAMNLGKPYKLDQTQICEMSRVALKEHATATTRIVAIAIRLLRCRYPQCRLIISFADPDQGHIGSIYKGGGWIYTGKSHDHYKFKSPSGKLLHPRQVSVSGLRPEFGQLNRVAKIADCVRVRSSGKHRYLMPLDDEMRARIEPLRKPYPKRAGSADSGTAGNQPEGGGATPTPALSMVNDG